MLEREAPDLEDLAAYLDGRLAGEKKERVEERLLRDEDYYEVFMETSRFQQEEAGEKTDVRSIFRRRAWKLAAIALPTAAALATVTFTVLRSDNDPTAGEWVAELDAKAIIQADRWGQPDWTTFRGVGDLFTREQLAFRLGAMVVHLQLALAAEDGHAARDLAGGIESLSIASALFMASSEYGRLRELPKDTELGQLTAAAAKAEDLLTTEVAAVSTEARRFRIGKWSEAGRLAALGGDIPALRRVLRGARDARISEEISEEIAEIDELLRRTTPSPDDLKSIQVAFDDIAKTLGG
ncbi:MAG: hypothetical protein GY719_39255 [bacterium]|nr:hypothetical protein [bacterium]